MLSQGMSWSLQLPHTKPETNRFTEAPAVLRLAKRDDSTPDSEERVNWRFRLPEIENIEFHDGGFGSQSFRTNSDFGDFVLWRHDDIPSYQLAVVVDDHDMKITEVVRGADLLKCTARQILLYHALGWDMDFFHCPLVTDETGERLAFRTDINEPASHESQGRLQRRSFANFNTEFAAERGCGKASSY